MALSGMDVEAVRALARQLDDAAEQLESLGSSLSASFDSVDWQGPDADAARAAWEAHHRPLLGAAGVRLRDGAQVLSQQADEQVAASEAAAGALAGPTGTSSPRPPEPP